MFKTIQLKLNAFPAIPPSLQLPGGAAKPQIPVDLARLYHHYYIDSRGMAPPDPDPTLAGRQRWKVIYRAAKRRRG